MKELLPLTECGCAMFMPDGEELPVEELMDKFGSPAFTRLDAACAIVRFADGSQGFVKLSIVRREGMH